MWRNTTTATVVCLLIASVGCVEYSWVDLGQMSEVGQPYRKTEDVKLTRERAVYSFDRARTETVVDESGRGALSARLLQTLGEEDIRRVTTKTVRDINTVKYTRRSSSRARSGLIVSALALVAGVVDAAQTGGDGDSPTWPLLLTGGAAGVTYTLTGDPDAHPERFETRTQVVDTATELLSTRESTYQLGERILRECVPAAGIPVTATADGFVFGTAPTSADGHVRVAALTTPRDTAFTEDALRVSAAYEDFQRMVTAAGKDALPPATAIVPRNVPCRLRALGVDTDERTVVNGQQMASIRCFELDIDSYLARLVDAVVNRRITRVRYVVKDRDTRTRIWGSTVTVKAAAPEAADALRPYLMGELVARAAKYVKPYERGRRETSGVGPDLAIDVLADSTVELEIAHPRYAFVHQSVTAAKGGEQHVVYLSAAGRKVRVERLGR